MSSDAVTEALEQLTADQIERKYTFDWSSNNRF